MLGIRAESVKSYKNKNKHLLTQRLDQKKIANIFSEKRKDRIGLIGNEQATEVEKRILLQSIDINWKLHIQYL